MIMSDEFVIQALRLMAEDLKMRPERQAEIIDFTSCQITAYFAGKASSYHLIKSIYDLIKNNIEFRARLGE